MRFRWLVVVLLVAGMLGIAAPTATASSGRLRWSRPESIDGKAPFALTVTPDAISCPAVDQCFGITQADVLSATRPTAQAWDDVRLIGGADPHNLVGISCPSRSFCVTIDRAGVVLSSADPTGPASHWRRTALPGAAPLNAVSCASTSLCVVVGQGGAVWSSTDPAAASPAWTRAEVDPGANVGAVSCPSDSLCVADDSSGHILHSTNPAGGASDWAMVSMPQMPYLGSVSCPTTSMCAATAGDQVFISSDPTGDASAWSSVRAGTGNALAISCPSASLCVATGENGFFSSANPTGGPSAWKRAWRRDYENAIDCPSVSLCLASAGGGLLVSTDPTGPAKSWRAVGIGKNVITGISCPSASLCVAVDNYGRVLHSSSPRGGPRTWRVVDLHSSSSVFAGVSCPAVSLCVALGAAGELAISTHPSGTKKDWRVVNASLYLAANLSCGSISLCASSWSDLAGGTGVLINTGVNKKPKQWAVGFEGDDSAGVFNAACAPGPICVAVGVDRHGAAVWASRRPTSSSSWVETRQGKGDLTVASCASVTLCVTAGFAPFILTSTQPTANTPTAWHRTVLKGLLQPTALSCGVRYLCALGDSAGHLASSTHPARGPSSWTLTNADPGHSITAASCVAASLCAAGDNAGDALIGET